MSLNQTGNVLNIAYMCVCIHIYIYIYIYQAVYFLVSCRSNQLAKHNALTCVCSHVSLEFIRSRKTLNTTCTLKWLDAFMPSGNRIITWIRSLKYITFYTKVQKNICSYTVLISYIKLTWYIINILEQYLCVLLAIHFCYPVILLIK